MSGTAWNGGEPPWSCRSGAGWFAFFHKWNADPGGIFRPDRGVAGAQGPGEDRGSVPVEHPTAERVPSAGDPAGDMLCQTMIEMIENKNVAKDRRNRRKWVNFSGVASVFLNF